MLFDAGFPDPLPAVPAALLKGGLPPVTLILGGTRAGKSRFAESLIERHGPGTYLATAEAHDAEMAARIAEHRARRGESWMTVEEPLDLAGAMHSHAGPKRPVLVDCLTLWLSNLMHAGRDPEAETSRLMQALPFAGPVVFVSNEVGLGIVPENALARDFRDRAGGLHQAVAAKAQLVVFMAAGLPLVLKREGP